MENQTDIHHILIAKGVENSLTNRFDKIAETDRDFRKFWNYTKKSRDSFISIDATAELSEEDAQLLAESLKKTYYYAKEQNRLEYAERKHKRMEALKNAQKKNTSTH